MIGQNLISLCYKNGTAQRPSRSYNKAQCKTIHPATNICREAPPLCKGRWVGVSRAGGIVQNNAQIMRHFMANARHLRYRRQSLSRSATAPFTQGSFFLIVLLPSLLPTGDSLKPANPQSALRPTAPLRGAPSPTQKSGRLYAVPIYIFTFSYTEYTRICS